MQTKHIRHVLFDHDGTLVDTEILAVDTLLDFLARRGHHFDHAYFCTRFTGFLERDIMAILAKEHGVAPPDEQFFVELRAAYHTRFERDLMPIAGMPALVRDLLVPKSLVSNAKARHIYFCMERTGFTADFQDAVFSAEQVANPKPAPDLYLFALQTLGLRPDEAIVVEDSVPGVAAGKSAGLRVVGFLGAAHIGDGHRAKLEAEGADFIAEDAAALRSLFKELALVK